MSDNIKTLNESIDTTITVDGKKYVLTDFDNAWTIRQNKAAAKVIADSLGALFKDTDTDLNSPVAASQIMAALVASEADIDLLAVIYLEEGETYFRPSTRDERRKVFADADIPQKVATEALNRFFNSGALSVQTGTQIFSALTK